MLSLEIQNHSVLNLVLILDLLSGTGANVSSLILKHKWSSLLLDRKNENLKINLHKHFLTP